jgi:hypothetical protein
VARIIEEVAVKIGADTRELTKGMKAADRGVKNLIGGFKKLAGVLGVAFGARALFRGFTRSLGTTNQLIKTAKGVGFLASEYNELVFSLSQVGVEASAARIALGDFQKRLAKPQFHKFFRQAGLDPQELQSLAPAAAFKKAFDHLATLVDHPKAAAFFGTIFEEQAGKNMLKAARQFSTLAAARERYASKVGGLDKDQQLRIERLSEEVGLYKAQWEVLKSKVVSKAVPQMLDALKSLDEANTLQHMADGMSLVVKQIAAATKALAEWKRESQKRAEISASENVSRLAHEGETPFEKSERLAYLERFKNTFPPLQPGEIRTATTINNHIDMVFNGVKDKNVPEKTKQAVTDATLRAP